MSTEEVRKAVAAWLAHWYPEAVCAAVVVQLPDGMPNEVLVVKSALRPSGVGEQFCEDAEANRTLTAIVRGG
jgi:hypothetical protein